MAIRLGDEAPDFTAETTEGTVNFYDYLGDGWGILFSHPADFTPVCTTELGEVARLKPEFEKRNTKVVGLSVDPVDSHNSWASDIKDATGSELNFPLLGDPDRTVAAAARCAEHGVRVGCFRPPSVPDGRSRLRLTARADLTEEDFARVSAVLRTIPLPQNGPDQSIERSGQPSVV